MAERAGLGAQTFLLPQPVAQRPEAQAQPFNDGIQALEGLQYVKGQTADYYKKAADLKSFMQSVQQNLGIDVRVPDLSRPESIKLNQTYRDALADLQAHGNELKQGAAINNMLISRGDIQTGSYGDQSAARAEYGKDFFNRNLEPSVMELNNKLQMPSYTREEYEQKEAARKAAVNFWTEQAKDPSRKEYAEYQLRGISPTTQGQWRPQADTSYDRKFNDQVKTSGNFLKKTTNLYLGTDESYAPNERKLDDGMPVLESREFRGRHVGEYILEGWRYYPNRKESFMLLKDPKTGLVNEQPITEEESQMVAAGLGNLDVNAMAEYTNKNKLVDEFQRLNKVSAAGFKNEEEREAKLEKNIAKSRAIYNHRTNIAVTELEKRLKSIKSSSEKPSYAPFSGNYSDDSIDIGPAKITKTKDGWEITNIKELSPQGNRDLKSATADWTDNKKWDNIQKLINYLVSKGILTDIINEMNPEGKQQTTTGTNSAPTKVTPANTGGAY